MFKLIKLLYGLYHGLFPSRVSTCRYIPTCSKYSLDAIKKYGIITGSIMSAKRVLSCHPLSNRPIYDPV